MTKKIIIWTDGSCLGNPGAGGWGFIAKDDDNKIIKKSGGEPETTNNRMELSAVVAVLEHFNNGEEITIHTDSEYVKNGMTAWIKNWKKNNWKASTGKPVKNRDLWEKLDRLAENRKISWCWVRGHNGDEMNEAVDELARSYAEKFR